MNNLTVVMYHYVRDLKKSRYPNIKGLDLKLFDEQIRYLQKHYRFITMEELIFSLENFKQLPKKSVLLTFDDGYIDHYNNVLPILSENKIQGSFYVPAKVVSENQVLDVNKIHFILASQCSLDKIMNIIKQQLYIHKKKYQLESFEYYYDKLAIANRFDNKDIIFIKRLLQVELDESLRNIITDYLFTTVLNFTEEEFSKKLYMNEKQIKEMLNEGMHIGCHGYNHYWWNQLSKDELNHDLDLSLEFLHKVGVDLTNWTACYPYGSYSSQAVAILKNKGCKVAFTTQVNVSDINKDHNLLLPRLDTNDLPKDSNSRLNHWYREG